MTDTERLAEIRERAEKATPGPWTYDDQGDTGFDIMSGRDTSLACFLTESDAAFLTNCRADVPWLLAALTRLSAENAAIRAQCEELAQAAMNNGQRPDLIAALLPCPFCGGTDVRIAKRDVEPQGDPWYGQKVERIVECSDCAATMFDRYWHEGFYDDDSAIAAWNKRTALTAALAQQPAPADAVELFSDRLFDYQTAIDDFEGNVAETGFDEWSHIHGDRHDNSIEFHRVPNDARLSRAGQQVIYDAGFTRIYVNHLDGWETHYFWDLSAKWFKESRAEPSGKFSALRPPASAPDGWVCVPKRPTIAMLLAIDGWTDLIDAATNGASETHEWKTMRRLSELALAWEVGWMTSQGIDINTIDKSYLNGIEEEITAALSASPPPPTDGRAKEDGR